MISVVVISKDERALDATLTAVAAQLAELGTPGELVVVDASAGRLADIAARHPGVRWLDFTRPAGVRVSIPHQRNAGVRAARGDVVVFTDAGCLPADKWLARLVEPVLDGAEAVTAGVATGGLYERDVLRRPDYLDECPTINLAFTRAAFDAVGGFDERFEYGSDVDFSWRLIDAGHRIRSVPDAVVTHDWGDGRRQLKRSFAYGKARSRLYRKHRARRGRLLTAEPMVVVYPVFLLGLPVLLLAPWLPWVLAYPLLLAVPAWRARGNGPARVVVDHLAYGAGVLADLAGR
ncbi:glycosyltransferase [Actinocorallia sp. API 0066]|uniref:glycosyltransferase family 2 protein n=1 Tax=Actinocorallia sp. API 0066 TaxID=2896846 RepID=UPI001E411E91|nr:glycosyltransferase [Actinocorallia sp. API 0066]MCD0450134.1 glycosyltransferase [Actinocorallia sp. API 0066]